MELLYLIVGAMIAGAVQQVRIARRDADLRRLTAITELLLLWWNDSTDARRKLEDKLRDVRQLVGLSGKVDRDFCE